MFSLVSSVLTLTLISCDRFFGIVFAMKAHFTERRALPLIAVIWFLSVGMSTPLLFYRHQFSREWANHIEIWCGDTWPVVHQLDTATNSSSVTHPSSKFYYTFISVVLYFIPIVIMTVAYSLIIAKLWRKQMPGERTNIENNSQMRMKRKVLVILLAFILLSHSYCAIVFASLIHRSSFYWYSFTAIIILFLV